MAKVTRRNTIIGLGALVAGTGTLAASGAFTSVEAQRDVDIQTAGDAEALLAMLPAANAELVDDSNDTIQLALSEDLNLRARSVFEGELVIVNNGNSEVDLDILSDFNGRSLVVANQTDETVVTFEGNGSISYDATGNGTAGTTVTQGTPTGLSSGDSVGFDVTIDFSDGHIDNDIDGTAYGSPSSPIDTVDQGDELLSYDFGELASAQDLRDGDGYLVIEATESSA